MSHRLCNSQFFFTKNTLDKSLLKLTVFCFILTKNRQLLSALQFLLSCFIRISEKKFLAYLPYSRDFLSLRRMKERRKNRHLFIEGAPSLFFCCLRQTMLRYSANEVALCANDVLLRKNCGREHPHLFRFALLDECKYDVQFNLFLSPLDEG